MARKHAGAQQARALPHEVFGVFVTVSCQVPPDEAGDGTPSGRAAAKIEKLEEESKTWAVACVRQSIKYAGLAMSSDHSTWVQNHVDRASPQWIADSKHSLKRNFGQRFRVKGLGP